MLCFMDLLSDAAGSKNSGTGKDNGTPQATEKVVPPLSASQEKISKEKSSGTRWLYQIICSVLLTVITILCQLFYCYLNLNSGTFGSNYI